MKIIVKVRPAKKKAQIIKQDNLYIVDIDAPAQDNKANNRLIELLSDYFHVAKSSVSIKLGKTSKQKIVDIAGV